MGCFFFFLVGKCRLASERKEKRSDLIENGLEQLEAFG